MNPLNKIVFTYDQDDCLKTYIETIEGKIINYYSVNGKELVKINVYKLNNKLQQKKTIVLFAEDIKLLYMFLENYGARITAVKKNSTKIETPKIENRVETINDEHVKGFTIKNDILDSWIIKL